MTSWFALSLFILLSVNAVLSAGENTYKDELIDNDPYLKNCITSSGTGNLKQDGVKKIHSGPECYAKTIIQFKVEEGTGNHFEVYNEQGNKLLSPAKIRYKFGDCQDIVVQVDRKAARNVYSIQHRDKTVEAIDKFSFSLIRRKRHDEYDTLYVNVNQGYIFDECYVFEKDPQDIMYPTLMLFEQEILSGVPDLILVWNVFLPDKKYFGIAYAKEIKELGTTTLPTTTSKPTTSTLTITSTTVASTTTEISTIAPTTVNSNSSLSITDAPKTDEKSKWFIFVIIVESVIILLSILALIGCLIMRHLPCANAPVDPARQN